MFKTLCVVSLLMAWAVAAAPGQAAPPPAQAAAKPDAVAPPSLPFHDTPPLQQKVTLAATDQPIGDVLTELSLSLQVDLRAERDVGDQRVTLHLTGQPVYVVMDRLVRLLSHHADAPRGYAWSPLDRAAGARPAFRLERDGGSVREEADARGYPQREIAVLLRDMRNMAGMSPQDQANDKGDYPHDFTGEADQSFKKAFKNLSDDQLDALAAGQPLPLDPTLFAEDMAAVRQAHIDYMIRGQKLALTDGFPDPYPKGLPDVPPPPPPVLTVTPTGDGTDDFGGIMDAPGRYLVSVGGASYGSLGVETYDTNKSRAPDRLPPPREVGPVVDLTPLLTAKDVTHAQRNDVGFTLQALARATRLSVYQEDFLHGSSQVEPSDPVPGDPGVGLNPLKASLPVLIAAICAHWDYQYQKVGDDYLFWSRTWAQDRADDVPERLIAPWRGRLQRQGDLTLDDRAEMAAALSWRQVHLTLSLALPESGGWDTISYPWLRFIGQLAPGQEQAAFSDGGLPLASLAPWQQEAMASGLRTRLKDVPGDQLSRAVLTLRSEDNPAMSNQIVIINLIADGARLPGGTRVAIPVPSSLKTPAQSTGGG